MLFEIAVATAREAERIAWAFPVGVGLELLFPRPGHAVSGRLKGAALWAVYLVAAGAFIAAESWAFRSLGLRPLFQIGPSSPWLLGLSGAVAALLIGDLFYYWCHRLQHTPLLWRFHAVHHAIRDMNALSSFHHWTEEPIHFFLLGLPMAALIRVAGPIQQVLAALVVLQTVYIHTPTRLHFGPLSRLLVDNRFHRIHHVIDARRAGHNFGVFTTLWDRLFGTACFPAPDEWPEVGLADRPECEGVLGYLVGPFRAPAPASVQAGVAEGGPIEQV